jgi:hypothetical protein
LSVGRDDEGRGMHSGSVIIDGGCGLGAEISGLGVEIERADAVGTVRAQELHAALDALDSVCFHCMDCIVCGDLMVRTKVTAGWAREL